MSFADEKMAPGCSSVLLCMAMKLMVLKLSGDWFPIKRFPDCVVT